MPSAASFLDEVCSLLRLRVDQLIFVDRPECFIERHADSILRETLDDACTGESVFLESDIDMVRVSIRLGGMDPPNASPLTHVIRDMFFQRLARETIPCLRRKPIPNFDVTFLFDYNDRGVAAVQLLRDTRDLWHTLIPLIRLRQTIGHRRAGKNLMNFFGPSTVVEETPSAVVAPESPLTSAHDDCWSVVTACADGCLGVVEELEGMEPDEGTGFLLF